MGIYIYGNGGHGKVVRGIVQSIFPNLIPEMVDDNSSIGLTLPEVDIQNGEWLIGIGDNLTRKKIVNKIILAGGQFLYAAIHSASMIPVAAMNQIGEGTVCCAGSWIGPDSIIGEHCIINTSATVDHDCKLGDFVHIAPGVNLCGGVEVGDLTLIGVGASVIPGIKIGRNCIIAGGTSINQDIPDNVLVAGNPGTIKKWNLNEKKT